MPTLRDPDGNFYVKPEPGALAVGGWEPNTRPWGADGIAHDFGPELLQPDFDRFAPLAEAAAARIPVLNEVGIRQMINGPIPITADGEPIIGLSPELDNFYLCCGFTSGIAASGGAGWVMANWIVDGDPGLDLWPFDVRRFGAPHSVKSFMYERAVESYAPLLPRRVAELRAGRGPRRAAQPAARDAARRGRRLRQQVRLGAAQLVRASRAREPVDVPSFERGAGVRGDRRRASRGARARRAHRHELVLQVRGARPRRARAAAEARGATTSTARSARIVYTQLCNERGGIEADVTITRLADDRFYFVTGSALGVRDRSTIERHMPADGSVDDRRPHVGQGRAQPVRPALARRARAADRRAARQRELPVHERARSSTSATRRCSRCA